MPIPHKGSLLLITVIALLIHTPLQSSILDFQYAEYTQVLNQNYQHHADLDFTPAQIPSHKLQFPQACGILELMNEPVKEVEETLASSDLDTYLNDMKAKFLRLLTLTQKLANSEEKILHFQALLNQTNTLPPKESQIIELQAFEAKLKNLTEKITTLDEQLKIAIDQIDRQNGNHQISEAKRIQLDYKIDWLKEKINYLRTFEQKARSAKQRAGAEIDYAQYFSEMQSLFDKEEGLISQIDRIIQKKDKMNELRKQQSNVKASVAALELYIADIKECNNEKEKIRNEFKNHQKINQLIHELKLLKKNEEPNIYCEGVVKKLTEKIRTMVRYYAIVASCASDLDPKLLDLAREKQRLNDIDEDIANFEGVDNLDDFEKDYKAQKSEVQKMYNKVKDWKMKQFIHDPQKIAEIRERAEGELLLIQRQRQAITDFKTGQQRQSFSTNVIEMIKQIRELKYTYCKTYHQYDSLSSKVWSETYRYEAQVNFKNNLWGMYAKEREAYDSMHGEMIGLRDEIYQALG